ncbi:MAG TPA: LuxR C-terminal-related transcriptional regulator [Paraburkholderia sp.]|uniref:helix-turn-helix transcriptional regulator n=1 Tax=Paraburkholderia sp. TaxID=1926495 RepID=UPI002ECFFD05
MTDRNTAEVVGFDLDLTYAVASSQNAQDLRDAAERFCRTYEFSFWIYGLAGPDRSLTNYPTGLVELYKRNGWHRGCDPIVNTIVRRRHSLSWDLDELALLRPAWTGEQTNLFDVRWQAGSRAGVSAPAFDRQSFEFGVVSFSRDQPLSATERHHQEARVQLFAAYFQSIAPVAMAVKKCFGEATTQVALSTRERDCLCWAAKGKTSWEIGQVLGISIATVNFHLANAAMKLGVSGRVCAIAQAIRLGLINPV